MQKAEIKGNNNKLIDRNLHGVDLVLGEFIMDEKEEDKRVRKAVMMVEAAALRTKTLVM